MLTITKKIKLKEIAEKMVKKRKKQKNIKRRTVFVVSKKINSNLSPGDYFTDDGEITKITADREVWYHPFVTVREYIPDEQESKSVICVSYYDD